MTYFHQTVGFRAMVSLQMYQGTDEMKKDHIRSDGKRWCRAVITVEAAYVVPWTVILLAILLTMSFYVHNRVWYTAAACETALSGNRYTEGRDGSGSAGWADRPKSENASGSGYAEATAMQRIRDQAMPGNTPEKQISCTKSGTEVSFSGQVPVFSQSFSWSVKESVRKVRPVTVVRSAWILKGILSGGEEEE